MSSIYLQSTNQNITINNGFFDNLKSLFKKPSTREQHKEDTQSVVDSNYGLIPTGSGNTKTTTVTTSNGSSQSQNDQTEANASVKAGVDYGVASGEIEAGGSIQNGQTNTQSGNSSSSTTTTQDVGGLCGGCHTSNGGLSEAGLQSPLKQKIDAEEAGSNITKPPTKKTPTYNNIPKGMSSYGAR